MDFLEHVMGVAALLHRIHALGNGFVRTVDCRAVLDPVQSDTHRGQPDYFPIPNTQHLAGERQDRRQVRRYTGEAIAQTGYQPGAFFDGVKTFFPLATNYEGIIAFQILVCAADGIQEEQPRSR